MKRVTTLALLLTVALLTALAAAPVYGDGPDDGLERADAARERHTDRLMDLDGVVGVALGFNPAGQAAVVVMTTRENVSGVPRKVDGVPVHVRVTGKIVALHHRGGHDGGPGGGDGDDDGGGSGGCAPTERCPRPVPIGVSTGHPDITAGTIGARVTDGTSVYALSNNHVYANSNQGRIGDAVIQPGTFDGGGTVEGRDDSIGTLHDFEPIKFDGSDNTMDAAIALSSTTDLGNSTLSDGYGTPRSVTAAASVNQNVQKYGRTTAQTKGKVWAINTTVDVGYGDDAVARFVDQVVVRGGSFSSGGDSGSLVVAQGGQDDRKPVGLLFAGSVNSTIFSPIDPVLTRFGVTVDGQ